MYQLKLVTKLFTMLKIAMKPVEDGRTLGVNKAAIKLMTQKSIIFRQCILEEPIPFFEQVLQLCAHDNMEIRDASNALLEEITKRLTEGLKEGKTHKEVFKVLIKKYNDIIENPHKERNSLIITVIRTSIKD